MGQRKIYVVKSYKLCFFFQKYALVQNSPHWNTIIGIQKYIGIFQIKKTKWERIRARSYDFLCKSVRNIDLQIIHYL